jgi:hypothetical protein
MGWECHDCHDLKLSNRPVRTRMPGGVAGAPPTMEAPYADVRPAWAHTCGCKSRCKLVTVSKVKRNCVRATERGKEAWNVNREPMNKNRIEGVVEQGEWARNHKALVTKAWVA